MKLLGKILFLTTLFFVNSKIYAAGEFNSIDFVYASNQHTLNVADSRTKNEQDLNEEGIDNDLQDLLETDISTGYTTSMGLRYRLKSDYVQLIFEYIQGQLVFTDADEELDDEENTLYLTDLNASLWLYTGIKSALIFSAHSKEEPYVGLNDDEDALVMKKERFSFASLTLEQYILGMRGNGLGFRVKGDAISNASKVTNRKGGSVNLFYEVMMDTYYIELQVGGKQIYKDTEFEDVTFTTTHKELGAMFTFGINF